MRLRQLARPESKLRVTLFLIVAALAVFYLGSRLYLLLRLPAFIDEAIHITWARSVNDGWIAAGLRDGKWLSIQVMSLFVQIPINPIAATRLTSVVSGFLTLVAIILIGRRLFSSRDGITAAVLYLFLPYALFFDRLALVDGLLAALGAWTLLVSEMVVRTSVRAYTVLLAVLLMASVLSKLSGALFVLIPILAVLILSPQNQWRFGFQKILPSIIGTFATLFALLAVGAGVVQLSEKTDVGNFRAIVELVMANLALAVNWYWTLLTPPVAIIALISLLVSLALNRTREILFLTGVFLATIGPFILMSRIWFPRYLLFSLVPICLIIARTLWQLEEKVEQSLLPRRSALSLTGVILVGMLIWPAFLDADIITNPEDADLPPKVRTQFVSEWPSGYGVTELVEFLRSEAEMGTGGINVLLLSHFTHASKTGLGLYIGPNEPVQYIEIRPDDPSALALIDDDLISQGRSYLVLDRDESLSSHLLDQVLLHLEATRIWRYARPGSETGLEVWAIHRVR